MPRKGITGHDEWVMTEALATALIALEQLPAKHQPRPHMDDIRKLLTAGCQPGTVNLHLAQAKCRLFPDIFLNPLPHLSQATYFGSSTSAPEMDFSDADDLTVVSANWA